MNERLPFSGFQPVAFPDIVNPLQLDRTDLNLGLDADKAAPLAPGKIRGLSVLASFKRQAFQ